MKQTIHQWAQNIGLEIRRRRLPYSLRTVSLKTTQPTVRGRVLIAYILDPLLAVRRRKPLSTAHTNIGESLLMADAFLELGFDVDFIDYRNHVFVPQKRYDVFVSARTNLERIAHHLNADCIKIAHLDTAHFVFNNRAAYARAYALQQRRGATCMSIRVVEPNFAIEYADHGALLGEEFLIQTYAFAQKPLHSLPIPAVTTFAFPEEKNYDTCRRRFLWFGSSGLVHKGLDLVLEAFSELPDYELWICGPVEEDKVFTQIYQRELYERKNIQVIGWVDVASPRFTEIADQCVALVFPTCSESLSASSVTCMHAGLIPVLSREAGIDVQNFGMLLEQSTIDEIRQAVVTIGALPTTTLQEMSRAAWSHVRARHTKEHYAANYRRMLRHILHLPGASSE